MLKSIQCALLSFLFCSTGFASNLPDRDLGIYFRGGDNGLSASIFLTDTIGLDLGYSVNVLSDKEFKLDGFMPFASGSYGIRAGLNLGLFWEQPAFRGVLLEQDEISWRLAARWRPLQLYQIEAKTVAFFEALTAIDIKHGTVRSIPLTAGVAYTWWALPWGKAEDWWSKLLDFGIVFRLEAGPDFTRYDIEKAPFMADPSEIEAGGVARVVDSKVEFYWNFQIGLVI